MSVQSFANFPINAFLIYFNQFLHNIQQQKLFISLISKRMRWARHVERMGEKRNAYRILVENPEGKRPLGRPRRRWVDNIKMDVRKLGWDGMVWIGSI
jgi:hypothetical protein